MFTFGDGGSITFTGNTDGASADVYFKFEYNPYPDVDPSYTATAVALGYWLADYTVNIPSQGNTFSSFLLYVTTTDVAVTLGNVIVNTSDASGIVDVEGCMDANATNYNADATIQTMTNGATYNVYILHLWHSRVWSIYPDGFGAFNEGFGTTACESYGGNLVKVIRLKCMGVRTKMPKFQWRCKCGWWFLWVFDAPADWNVIVTGSNHTIVIPSSHYFTSDGNVLDLMQMLVYSTLKWR